MIYIICRSKNKLHYVITYDCTVIRSNQANVDDHTFKMLKDKVLNSIWIY